MTPFYRERQNRNVMIITETKKTCGKEYPCRTFKLNKTKSMD